MSNVRFFNYLDSLRFKTHISLLIVAIIPLLLYLSLNNKSLTDNFLNLEKKDIQNAMPQVLAVINTKIREMERIAVDYAVWDEAYQKLQSQDRAWFKENYSDWLPANQEIDLIAVLNRREEIIDLAGIQEDEVHLLLENDLLRQVLDGKYDHSAQGYPSGLVKINNQLYLIGICPVQPLDYDQPSVGAVVLGKKITSKLLGDIERKIGYNIALASAGIIVTDRPNSEAVLSYLEAEGAIQDNVIVEESLILSSSPLYDISGQQIARLFLIGTREMFTSTLALILRNGITALGLAIFVIILLAAVLRNVIIAPLQAFEAQIKQMAKSSSLEHVHVTGSREIIGLANTFNEMINSILEQKRENENLRLLSITDSTTLLYNHRYLFEYFDQKIALGCREMCLLFCDIDHFKVVNDTRGHLTGDVVIIAIANIIKKITGKKGAVFRYGGEEFVVLLLDASPPEASEIAEKIRLAVHNANEIQEHRVYLPITVSIGIAFYPGDALQIENLLEKADLAMYAAKQNGRNQCCFYQQDMEGFQRLNILKNLL